MALKPSVKVTEDKASEEKPEEVMPDQELVQGKLAPDEEVEVVRVRAVFNRMRNPYTAAVFTKTKVTDVIDLQSKDNTWTRHQINAKVLEIVK